MDISIIIPVFNSQEFLERCLDSVLKQEVIGSFEVIAVNDGSTDNSLTILKNYQDRYANLKIVDYGGNFSNAVARRNGINAAQGDYIVCLDSDDFMSEGSITKLLDYKIKYNNPDVILYDYVRHDGSKVLPSKRNLFSIAEFNESNKAEIQHMFMGACWNKMVKRNLLDDLIFGTFYMNNTEDLIYAFEVFVKAQRIITIPEAYYNYFVNYASLSNNVDVVKHLNIQVLVFNTLYQLREKYGHRQYFDPIFEYLRIGLVQSFYLNHIHKRIPVDTISSFFTAYKMNVSTSQYDYVQKLKENFFFSLKEMISTFGLLSTLKILMKELKK